jgi:hypothetical protein
MVNKDYTRASIGNFRIEKDSLFFTTTSVYGDVDYKRLISSNGSLLDLENYSHINNTTHHHTYGFYQL